MSDGGGGGVMTVKILGLGSLDRSVLISPSAIVLDLFPVFWWMLVAIPNFSGSG